MQSETTVVLELERLKSHEDAVMFQPRLEYVPNDSETHCCRIPNVFWLRMGGDLY